MSREFKKALWGLLIWRKVLLHSIICRFYSMLVLMLMNTYAIQHIDKVTYTGYIWACVSCRHIYPHITHFGNASKHHQKCVHIRTLDGEFIILMCNRLFCYNIYWLRRHLGRKGCAYFVKVSEELGHLECEATDPCVS